MLQRRSCEYGLTRAPGKHRPAPQLSRPSAHHRVPAPGQRLDPGIPRGLRRLRAQRYDLALDPIPESTGGRVALTLCRTSVSGRIFVGIAAGAIDARRRGSWLEFWEAFLELEPDAIPVEFLPSDPVLYGPLKPVDLAINIAESTPRLVARRCQRSWRESIGGNSARH
jgi:hypothetical protein